VEDVLALAAELIRWPTPNPPGEERPLAEFIADLLGRRGLEATVLPVAEAGPRQANVVARLPGRGTGQTLVLCGHLDTVPPGEGAWTRDPYQPAIEQGRLYGLGAADMKGAIAAMVEAITRLASAPGGRLAGDVLLALTSGEETGSLGARSLTRTGYLTGASGLVIGEPTHNRLAVAEKGGIWLDVVFQGRTAHGSLPHLGANAAAGLAAALVALEAAAASDCAPGGGESPPDRLRLALAAPEDPLLGRPTLTPTRLQGGVANNVVPDRAMATLDVRTLPGQSHRAIVRALEDVLHWIAAPRGLTATLVDRGDRPPLATAVEEPLVVAAQQAIAEGLGRAPEWCALTGATDATEIVPVLGLPFVICGPGAMAQAHQPDEFVEIEALFSAVEIYCRLARIVCA
jgi:succinyl-diaminopimelate desuccinylase